MPIMAVIEMPGGSRALDAILLEASHRTGYPPQGNRLRMAGPMDGGWRVLGLWDTTNQLREYIESHLHLSLEGGEGQPAVTLWEIETVHYFARHEQRDTQTTDPPI